MISQPRPVKFQTARREGESEEERNGGQRQRAATGSLREGGDFGGLTDVVQEGLPRNLEDRVLQQQQ